MADKFFTKVMVETKEGPVQIEDLPREQYEEFLEIMHALRIAYISIQTKE